MSTAVKWPHGMDHTRLAQWSGKPVEGLVQQGVDQATLWVVRFKRGIESRVQKQVKRTVDACAVGLLREWLG